MYFRKHGIEYVFMGIHMSLFSGTDYTIISGGEGIFAHVSEKKIFWVPPKNRKKAVNFQFMKHF